MGLFDFLKKESEYISGLNLDSRGQYQLIELKKINTSWAPVYHRDGIIKDFVDEGVFHKKEFISLFKEIAKSIHNKNIFLNELKNQKLLGEIVSALKIAGFENVKIRSDKNIEGIILDQENPYEEMTVLLRNDEVTFYLCENGFIVQRTTIPLMELSVAKITKTTEKLKEKHIFMVGPDEEQ